LNSEAALLGRLFTLTRGDLDRAVFAFTAPPPFVRDMTLFRLRRLGCFWERDRDSTPDGLVRATEDLIGGLYAQNRAWTFCVEGDGGHVTCVFGAIAREHHEPVDQMLRAAFPGVRLEPVAAANTWAVFRHAIVVTGSPSVSAGENEDRIERLVRGLLGKRWLYVVHGRPVPPQEATKAINETTSEIRDVTATFMLKDSAIDDAHRSARRYVDLLEAKLQRLEQARATGRWDTRVAVYTDSESALPTARGLVMSAFGGRASSPQPLRCCDCAPDGDPDVRLEPLGTSEVARFAVPPREEYVGYTVVEHARYGVDPGSPVVNGLEIGRILDHGLVRDHACRIAAGDLTKHTLVVGVTGSGKTTTCMSLLRQAAVAAVPVLIIESAKSEYRGLIHDPQFRDALVFTVGNETVTPLRLNPFEVPAATLVQTHIDYLNSLFSAAFVLYPPMPYVLEQSLREVYEDRGWDIARNTNRRGAGPAAFPRLSDLAAKIGDVVERMGYDERITMDVKAGLLARIDQLRHGGGKGLMLDTRRSVPTDALFERHCLLELKSLVSDDEKAFIIGLVLIRLYEHCESRPPGKGLRHLTLIEEAHRLLRNTSTEQGSEIAANPRGRAIEVFTNMLAELRAFGEGFVLAEQIPDKLVPEAVKQTNLKITHRLVAADDRALMGGAMRLDPVQERHLTLLETGEAVVFREGLPNAVLVRVTGRLDDAARPMRDEEVMAHMDRFYAAHLWLREPNAACGTCLERTLPASCGRTPSPRPDPAFDAAFHGFFTALRFASPSGAMLDVLGKRVPSGSGRRALLCAVNEALEAELNRRGLLFQWALDDLEALVRAGADAVAEVQRSADESRTRERVRSFAAMLHRLQSAAVRPFAACTSCPDPCQFRLDVAPVARRSREAFRRAFENRQLDWPAILEVARSAARTACPAVSAEVTSRAAFCVVAHHLADPALSEDIQDQLGRRVAALLEGAGTGGD
jgi:hypothetical protein